MSKCVICNQESKSLICSDCMEKYLSIECIICGKKVFPLLLLNGEIYCLECGVKKIQELGKFTIAETF